MANVGKHALRTSLKTIPIAGKPMADALMPLGHKTIAQTAFKPYNSNSSYDQSSANYTYNDREVKTFKTEKIEAPFEDAIAGGVQAAGLVTAGALTGNPQLTNMGVQRGMQTIGGLGNQKEKSAMEDASQWVTLMANNMDMLKKKGTSENTKSAFNSLGAGITGATEGINSISDIEANGEIEDEPEDEFMKELKAETFAEEAYQKFLRDSGSVFGKMAIDNTKIY